MVTEEPTPLEDIVLINDQTIEKLTHGLMAHYLPDLQDSKQALQELTYVMDRECHRLPMFRAHASVFYSFTLSSAQKSWTGNKNA